MRDPKNDFETFIKDKYAEHGVENIYGAPKQDKEWLKDLIDTTIQTYIIKGRYFFVIYGFKKSEKKL